LGFIRSKHYLTRGEGLASVLSPVRGIIKLEMLTDPCRQIGPMADRCVLQQLLVLALFSFIESVRLIWLWINMPHGMHYVRYFVL